MSDPWTTSLEVLAELGRSDVDGPAPHPAYSWLATSGAHVCIGMLAAMVPDTRARARLGVALAVLWVLKELAFDLRIDGFAFWTWADSAADLSFGALGFWLAYSAVKRAGQPAFPSDGKPKP